MLSYFTTDAKQIYPALGPTDFRKQPHSLAAMVQLSFGKDPFEESCVFLFCNKRKDSIKVLRFDKNGFVLAQKKLLEEMKFCWPKEEGDLKEIDSDRKYDTGSASCPKEDFWILFGKDPDGRSDASVYDRTGTGFGTIKITERDFCKSP